jgi:glutaredoxin
MGRILIYTLAGDSACARAKELLVQKQRTTGTALVEINLTDYPKRSREMKRLTGKRSVPQIFFNSLHVGVRDAAPFFPAISLISHSRSAICALQGAAELQALEKSNKLDEMLEKGAHKARPLLPVFDFLTSRRLVNAQLQRRRHHPHLCPQATRTSSWPKH